MQKKLWICGVGGSGKDYLRKKFETKGYKFAIHYTTRPKRDGEVDGEDYFFTNVDNFKKMIDNNELIEYSVHNDWYYGLSYEEFNDKDLFIISLKSYLKYDKDIKNKVFKIFLDIKEDVRRERLSKRNDADSVERRMMVDNIDISNIDIKEFDLVIKNEDF